MKSFRDGTERNVLGTEGFDLVLKFSRYLDFLSLPIGLLFIVATFIISLDFKIGHISVKIINIITLFKQLCFQSENNDRHLGMFIVLKSVTFVVC